MNDYGDDDDEGAVQQTKKLAFVLSQLRDDLDEIVSGLEWGGSLQRGKRCCEHTDPAGTRSAQSGPRGVSEPCRMRSGVIV